MKSCPFCNIVEDDDQQIVMETHFLYFLQKQSEQEVLTGSGVIIPKEHRQTLFELTDEEWQETFKLLHQVKGLLGEKWNPDGYNVGWNVFSSGGQSIAHAHLHIIPRFKDEPYAGKGMRYWIKQPKNRRYIQEVSRYEKSN
ncbi:HIT family protein [Pontibacillus salicampi]|uniref:HIT family protein n=1 Tax=Pontibacillus salicampi TaxID=1449801 RepID=A0ABV6LPV4_9BACI